MDKNTKAIGGTTAFIFQGFSVDVCVSYFSMVSELASALGFSWIGLIPGDISSFVVIL